MLRTGVVLWLLAALLLAPIMNPAVLPASASICLSQQNEVTATVKVSILNVRAGPGTNYRVLSQVRLGMRLIVLDWTSQGDWLKITTPTDITGWVSGRLVEMNEPLGISQAPPVAASSDQPRLSNAPPGYASAPFRPNIVTSRQTQIHECFGIGESPLRVVSAGTPVQVVGKAAYEPPPEESAALGQGTFLKIRLWDGQYAWIPADAVQIDPSGLPTVSNRCETYDRIDWTKVIRPTPTPTPRPADGGGSSGCCKICRTGKACGNTCIARSKTCHVGPGCACNG